MAKWVPFEGFVPERAKRENWVARGWLKKIKGKWYFKGFGE